MPIRPEAEQKLRAGFQRRVDRQAERYAAQLTHAEQLAVRLECGEVAGVFSGQAGGGVRRGTYAVGLLPLAAIPVLIAGAAVGVPGMVPLLGATPFITGAWFGLTRSFPPSTRSSPRSRGRRVPAGECEQKRIGHGPFDKTVLICLGDGARAAR